MTPRHAIAIVALCVVWVVSGVPMSAHRLDEYLQATRIAINPTDVRVEIDLTPGVAVASTIYAAIDSDADGRLSSAERDAYATLVVSSALLEMDGVRTALALTGSHFPSLEDMRSGVGAIHLTAIVPRVTHTPGRHDLYFRNIHRADMSVYLVNALMPPAGEIRIATQVRDTAQHDIRLGYDVGSDANPAWTIAAGLGMLAALAYARGAATKLSQAKRNRARARGV